MISFSVPWRCCGRIGTARTTDSSLASPSKARLRTSLGMTRVCRALVSCTLALLRPHGKDSRFLARLAEPSSASDFARNDKGLPRSHFLYPGAAAAALALQEAADSSLASPSQARLRTSLGMTRVLLALPDAFIFLPLDFCHSELGDSP